MLNRVLRPHFFCPGNSPVASSNGLTLRSGEPEWVCPGALALASAVGATQSPVCFSSTHLSGWRSDRALYRTRADSARGQRGSVHWPPRLIAAANLIDRERF